MADVVFISYAREDRDFVHRLHEELTARGRDAWVDWEDIPLTADWWAEIQRGIEASNAFVFIISPDSAQSTVCFREIEHAVKHNKRLVPILYRDLSPDDERRLHPSINAHNWIFIREDDTFDKAFGALLTALDTDLDYVREHTALLIRARTWELRQRDPSLLLREQALRDAEAWLAEGMTKEHGKPTDLHVDYITTSRRAQNRRTQRMWAVGGALGIITALMIVSLVLFYRAENERQKADEQRQIADEQRVIAEEQRRIAESNEERALFERNRSQAIGISAQARLELFGLWPERGVLLALEVLESDLPYVYQAEQALAASVQTSRAEELYDKSPSATNGIAWSPDGTRFITVGDDNTAQVRDVATGAVVLTLIGHTNEISAAEWSPDGTQIATASWDKTARVWDAVTGASVQTFPQHTDWVTDVAWSPNGAQIATASVDKRARIWDVATGTLGMTLTVGDGVFTHDGFVNSVAWSPDGLWLLTAGQDHMVRIWDVRSGTNVVTWEAHEGNVAEAAWSPDGWYVVTASWDETAKVWDVRRPLGLEGYVDVTQEPVEPELRFNLAGHINRVNGVAWSPDGAAILTASSDRTIKVWDAATGDHLFTLSGHTQVVNDAVWSPEGDYILSVGEDQQARLWAVHRGKPLLTFSGEAPHTSRINAVAWSPDGSAFVTASADRTAKVWDATTGVLHFTYTGHTRALNTAAWSPVSNLIATAGTDTTVRVWDAFTGADQVVFEGHGDVVNAVTWSPDGTHIASVCNDGVLLIWDAATGDIVFTLPGHDTVATSVSWSADGAWIVSADANGKVIVWDAASGAQLVQFRAHTQPVRAAMFSDLGQQLVTVSDDGTGKVWLLSGDAYSGDLNVELVATLSGHTERVNGAVWSPNSTRVATVSEDRSARVWDAATGAELFVLTGHTDGVLAVDWSPDGTQLVTTSADRTAQTWRVWETTNALIAFAQDCCVVRTLTPDERAQFDLPEESISLQLPFR